jgi:hypothetical protein
MSNNETVVFYNPPLTRTGDRDWRKEVRGWMRLRNSGNAPLDLNTIVVIDNLLDALDAARKEIRNAEAVAAEAIAIVDALTQNRKENA